MYDSTHRAGTLYVIALAYTEEQVALNDGYNFMN